MSNPTKFLNLQVMRPAEFPDCTLDGVSSRFARLTLVGVLDERNTRAIKTLTGDHGWQSYMDGESRENEVVLHVRAVGTDAVLSFVPVDRDDNGVISRVGSPMFGGNYATGDSRLSSLVQQLTGNRFYGAIAVHDRIEG